MLLLDIGLRGAAVALLLLICVVLLRDWQRSWAGRLGALLALGAACYAVEAAPGAARLPDALVVPLRLVSLGTTAVFWLFAAAWFDDEFVPSWRHAAAWAGLVAVGGACVIANVPAGWLVYEGLSLAFIGLAIGQALSGRAVDLVEGRRRFRLVVVGASGLYSLGVLASNVLSHGAPAPAGASLTSAAGIAALAFAVAAARLRFSEWGGIVVLPVPASEPAARQAAAPAAPAPLDGEDARLLAALRRAMEEDRAYRAEGFGIAVLADRLDIPEYRLRRLINQRLGHRNFTGFVNSYRLAEAMAALSDPAQDEVPILTIALDAGFQSIGPFNRAFKAQTGMTPTEFRRQRPGAASETRS